MIDLHCHVLPGLDDGPDTLDESVTLAVTAADAGTDVIVATPHVSWDYPNRVEAITRLVAELNGRLREGGVPLEVRSGAEVAMTRAADTAPEELSRLTIGGSRWLLLEPPFTPVISGLEVVIANLHDGGLRVLLAHPERCPAFQRDRMMLRRLVDVGVLLSLTAGSLDGRFGGAVRRFSLELVRDELVHNVASDAHDHLRRPPSIAAELERSGLGMLTPWLTEAVPAAILSDAAIPPRPAIETRVADRSRWTRRLLGRA